VAHVNQIDGQEAAKVIARNRLVQIRIGAGGGTSYTANTTGPWPLGMSDGFKLVSVRKKSSSNFSTTTEGTDVTNDFILDTGMGDNYYDHARLKKKSSSSLSIASGDRLLVTFDHFTHSHSSGVGYFSVDSYPVNDTTAGTDTSKMYTYEIPVYVSPTSGIAFDLRDCVDVRPRIADTANSVTALTNISINPLTSTTFYNPTGCLKFPPTGQDFTTDADYYLKRIDTVAVTQAGIFNIVRGVPNSRPSPPSVPEDMMALATISLAPYPSLPVEIARRVNRADLSNNVRKIRNERYTMRDIGTIRDRVDRLEYYTSLNLLEKNTKDLLIPDASGLDRFKNGILVDSFKGYAVANPFDNDTKWTVDSEKGKMRPLMTLDNVALTYTANSSGVVRTNVTPAGISKDQTVIIDLVPSEYVSTRPENGIFGNLAGATITSGSVTATIRNMAFQQITGGPRNYGIKLYVENATGNFTAGGSVSISDSTLSGASVPIVSVSNAVPGDLVTLPYSHDVLVTQPYATTTRNCVGTAFLWRGTITITPDSDYWMDTTQRPDVDINIDLNTDNWIWLANAWPTSWNGWQQTFVGTPVLSATNNRDTDQTFVPQADGSTNVMQNFITQNIYTVPTIETRTGNKIQATVTNSKQTLGNFVKDVNIQPFMRSRMIIFKIVGMKSSSRIYGFFDSIDVNRYITPLTADEYNSGLKVNGVPTRPTAVEGDALNTGPDGSAYGVFRLPSDSSLRFRTGTKRLRFVDNPTNSIMFGQFTTSAETDYTSEGLMAGISDLTLSTKRATISQQLLTEIKNVNQTTMNEVGGQRLVGVIPGDAGPGDGGGGGCGGGGGADGGCGGSDDPIAQTMLISALLTNRIQTSGMYLTKLDLYFATKDASLPIIIELREVDPATGYITTRVVPFSRVVVPSADINISDDGSAVTPVYFPSPVYVGDGKEYAMVLIPAGTNPNYNAFTAVLGEKDIATKSRVSEQPAAGFLFTSANQRTWVPVENEDLKFTAYYAKFASSSTGTLVLKNENRDYFTIANTTGAFNKIGELVYGEQLLVGTFSNTKSVNTAGSILCYAQGQTSGATGTITSWSTSAIRIKGNSIGAAFKGGETIKIRNTNPTTGVQIGTCTALKSATYPVGRAVYYDVVNYANTKLHIANTAYANSGPANSANRMFFPGMYITGQTNAYTARIVTIDSVSMDNVSLITNLIQPSNTSVLSYAKFASSTSTRDSTFGEIIINDVAELSSPHYILSRSTEANTSASSSTMARNKSAEIQYVLGSQNAVASPAIDLRRISLVATRNLISSNAEIGSSEDWVKSGGNSKTRYVTRRVTLADGQDAEDLRVYLAAYIPPGSDVKVYAKILNADDNDLFEDARWIPMSRDTSQGYTGTTRYSSSINKEDYIELTYNMPNFPTTAITDTSGRAINQYGANNTTGYVEYRNSTKARYVRFKFFAVKVVLTADTSTNPPTVHELRAIALQR